MQGRVQPDDANLQLHSGFEHPGSGKIQGVLRRAEGLWPADGLKQGEKACRFYIMTPDRGVEPNLEDLQPLPSEKIDALLTVDLFFNDLSLNTLTV